VSYKAEKKLAVLNPTGRLLANTPYTAMIEGARDRDVVAVKERKATR